MPSSTADLPTPDERSELVRRYLTRIAADAADPLDSSPPSAKRRLGTTLALWPMLATAALPVTGLIGAVVGAATRGVGLGALSFVATALIALGIAHLVARQVLKQPSPPHVTPAQARIALTLAVVLPVIAVAEVVSGGHFANAMLLAWPLAFMWCWSFLAQDRRDWSVRRVAQWTTGVIAIAVVLVLEVSGGLFAARFDASRADLVSLGDRIAAGESVPAHTKAGSFELVIERRVNGCDASFVIDGWWKDDRRWVAWCPAGRPKGVVLKVNSLGHGWYEVVSG